MNRLHKCSFLVTLWIMLWVVLLQISPAYAQQSLSTIYLPLIANTKSANTSSCILSSQEQQLANLMHNAPEQGRSSLTCNPILTEVARTHAQDMATRGYFSSTSPEGVGPNARVRQAGYLLPAYYSTDQTANNIESIFAGYASADKIWAAAIGNAQMYGTDDFWSNQTEFGIGYYADPNSPFGHYWVVVTALPRL